MHDLRTLIAIPVAVGAAVLAFAVARTWDRAMTQTLLGGVLAIGGLVGVGAVLGGSYLLSLRHQGQARPAAPAAYQIGPGIADPLTVHKAIDLASRTAERERQAALGGWTPSGYAVTDWQSQEGEGWE